mgnify:FL=1
MCNLTLASTGPVGGFCYQFCFCWVVHGPSAGYLLRYCLGTLLCDYVMALIVIIQTLFAGNVLSNFRHSLAFVHTVVNLHLDLHASGKPTMYTLSLLLYVAEMSTSIYLFHISGLFDRFWPRKEISRSTSQSYSI